MFLWSYEGKGGDKKLLLQKYPLPEQLSLTQEQKHNRLNKEFPEVLQIPYTTLVPLDRSDILVGGRKKKVKKTATSEEAQCRNIIC